MSKIWSEVEAFPVDPHKSLKDIISRNEYVFEKREQDLFRCFPGDLDNQEIIFRKEKGFKIQEFLEKRIEKISEHFHKRYGRYYKHTVEIVKPIDMELYETLSENHDLFLFLDGKWKAIFRKYDYTRKDFFEIPRRGSPTYFRYTDSIDEKLLRYSARNECDVKEARFALMLIDKEFREEYKGIINKLEKDRNTYETYKRFTNELDRLEEEYEGY